MKDLSKYLRPDKKGLSGLKAKVLQTTDPEIVTTRPVQAYQPVAEWVRERHDTDSEEEEVQLDQDGDLDVQVKPATVVRDAEGRAVDPKSMVSKEDVARARNEEALEKWRGGLVQAAQKRSLAERLREESSKPFSRYEIDTEADLELRQKDRFGDPLALFSATKQVQPEAEIGFAYANRFGIPPGRRWDGVDRSNGFEVRYLNALASSKAKAPEAYREANLDM